ncbi:hypothetical protein VM98_37370, partial [Streptomyces rubellomurinus subsp. indigoferus]
LGDGGLAPVPDATRHPDLAALARALDDGLPAPALVVLPSPTADTPGPPAPEAVPAAVARALNTVQTWIADPPLAATRPPVVTRSAAPVGDDHPLRALAAAAVGGPVRA